MLKDIDLARSKANEMYYESLGSIHYLVKLNYSMKELLELSPIELTLLQYKIKEIEENLAKQREMMMKSSAKGGVSGEAY